MSASSAIDIHSTVQAEADIIRLDTSLGALYRYAQGKGWNNGRDFKAYKAALRDIGLDYDSIRDQQTERGVAWLDKQEKSARKAARRKATLHIGANVETGRFCIADRDRFTVWADSFSAQDRDFDPAHPASATLATVNKGIWLAAKVRSAHGDGGMLLDIRTETEWLLAAQKASGPHGVLNYGISKGILVSFVRPPPDRGGPLNFDFPKHWGDNDLKALAEPIQ